MNTQKIVEVFSERKNNTEKAITDLFRIMSWITEQVDNVTVKNSVSIHFRASGNCTDYGTWKKDSDNTSLYLQVVEGTCGLYYYDGDDEYYGHHCFEKWNVDYINLADVQKALSALLEKLETFPTRKESAERLHALAKLISE
jgi:hypothetical protein